MEDQDPIEKQLGLRPLANYERQEIEVIEGDQEDPTDDDQFEEDLDQARTNMYEASDIASSAIEEMAQIARGSQHPNAYNALNGLLKTYAEINRDIVGLHTNRMNVKKKGEKSEPGTVNNNLITTTEQVLALLGRKEGEPGQEPGEVDEKE